MPRQGTNEAAVAIVSWLVEPGGLSFTRDRMQKTVVRMPFWIKKIA